ncbi:AAA family ATPase [Vibrio mexicanus]|uniref:AAA family ATPase n=1 Tax=Vibrio mexicanus TaxID=1004326 RepID=UPI00069A4DFC|nr:ATP-binding protein [Vibrio mexicanus]
MVYAALPIATSLIYNDLQFKSLGNETLNTIRVTKIKLHRFKRYDNKKFSLPDGFCLLAGGNNSGKSSFMQAFAVWEFCKSVVTLQQGENSLLPGNIGKKQGVGVNSEDFLPINLPSLKHLWTNLKVNKLYDDETDGYTLWLEVNWVNDDFPEPRRLRFSLSLANERLFIKVTGSNLVESEEVPKAAYIPPFAGILHREPFHTTAMRSRLVGQGLSGSVMRNTLLELHRLNTVKRSKLKGDKPKIPTAELKKLRETDRWEHLVEIMRRIFGVELIVHDFDERFHSYIKIEYWKGAFNEKRTKFEKYKGFNRRDIMVEGSGFLQLLNVLSLVLDPQYRIVFLDEPDAHLHPKLQFELLSELEKIAVKYNKQILFATHSTELIASRSPKQIMRFENGKAKLLSQEAQKIALIAGLGADYSPILKNLQRSKKIVFVEHESDENALKILAEKLGGKISEDIVFWAWTGSHAERLHLFKQLRSQIGSLKGVSIRDRDGQDFNTVSEALFDKQNNGCETEGLKPLTWRYRYIETYFLCVQAIARSTSKSVEDITKDTIAWFGIDLNCAKTDSIATVLQNLETKEMLNESNQSICKKYSISKYDVIKAIEPCEIHQDIKTAIDNITAL